MLTRLWNVIRRPPQALKGALLLAAMIFYTTAGFMYFELDNRPELRWIDALWWSVVTMSTVGFGDYFPVSVGGRLLVGVPAMMVGVATFGFAFGQAAAFLVRAEAFNRKGFNVQKLPDAILVCNYPSRPRFLRVLHEIRGQPSLAALPVVLIDEHQEELDEDLADERVHFVRGHPGREHTLQKAGINLASRAVVLAIDPKTPTSDNLTLAISLSIKQLRPDVRVVAECVDPENEEILRRAGCESIVCVMNLGPSILAHELYDPGVVDVLHELTIFNERRNNIFVVPVQMGDTAKTIADLRRWSAGQGVTMLGLRRQGRITLNPLEEEPLTAGDDAVLMGPKRPSRVLLS